MDTNRTYIEPEEEETGSLTARGRIRGELADAERARSLQIGKLGETVYAKYRGKSSGDQEIDLLVGTIAEAERRLDDLEEQLNHLDGRRTCPSCGASVPLNSQFCSICGAKLPPAEGLSVCPRCGKPLQPGDKFCINCGYQVRPTASGGENPAETAAGEPPAVTPEETSAESGKAAAPENDSPAGEKAAAPEAVVEAAPLPVPPAAESDDFRPEPVGAKDDFRPEPVGEKENFQPEIVGEKDGYQPEPEFIGAPDVCPVCGSIVPFGHEFCSNCGCRLRVTEEKKNFPGAYLVMKMGNVKFRIDRPEYFIGSDRGNLRITDRHISREHAEIQFCNGDFFLKDRKSQEGTFLNGSRISPEAPEKLKDGDRISFSDIEAEFHLGEA
jgi:predicted nucleic acid-binding Zn ribbon protein